MLRNKKYDFNAVSLVMLSHDNRETRLQKIPAAGDFYYSSLIWRLFFI